MFGQMDSCQQNVLQDCTWNFLFLRARKMTRAASSLWLQHWRHRLPWILIQMQCSWKSTPRNLSTNTRRATWKYGLQNRQSKQLRRQGWDCLEYSGITRSELYSPDFSSIVFWCFLELGICLHSKSFQHLCFPGSVDICCQVAKNDVPFGAVKKSDEPTKTHFTEEDFARSNAGFKNVRVYMSKMKSDYESFFHNLEGPDSKLLLRKDIKCTWPEMLARSQSYFRRYLKTSSFFAELSKEEQAMSYLGSEMFWLVP